MSASRPTVAWNKFPVRFDPDPKCPSWEDRDEQVDVQQRSLVEYLQVGWGVTLTSDTSLQVIFFNQGRQKNGKDAAFTAISYILGTYWQNLLNFMIFAETKNHSEHRNDSRIDCWRGADGHVL